MRQTWQTRENSTIACNGLGSGRFSCFRWFTTVFVWWWRERRTERWEEDVG